MAGPVSTPAASAAEVTTLAAVISSGLVARSGTSEPCAGRVTVTNVAAPAARAMMTATGAPASMAAPTAP
jgi:hypothetical protein